MTDFAGWELPLTYGSSVAEHLAVRTSAGLFDVSHMLVADVLDNAPESALAFLKLALGNDVSKLAFGKALYSALLDDKAGVVDDLIVWRLSDRYRLVLNAGRANEDVAWLQGLLERPGFPTPEFRLRRDLGILALQGPQAARLLVEAFPSLSATVSSLRPFYAALPPHPFKPSEHCMLSRTGYTGEDGFEIIVPLADLIRFWDELVKAGATPAGLGARDSLRLEAGMCLWGHEMDQSVRPDEAGIAWTLDFGSGRDFIGRKALEASLPRWTLKGIVLVDPGVLRSQMLVHSAQGEGITTSGGHAPSLKRSIALARLPVDVHSGDVVQVALRNGLANAWVVDPPFVRNGKVLVSVPI